MADVTFTHILAPTDFSKPAGRALAFASSLARAYHARLTLLHVLGVDTDVEALSAAVSPILSEYVEHRSQEAIRQLEAVAGTVDDLDVEILLKRGTPSVEIVNTADEDGCDGIVISTHGTSALRHMLFGSTAERVVRRACCPVLTVPTELD